LRGLRRRIPSPAAASHLWSRHAFCRWIDQRHLFRGHYVSLSGSRDLPRRAQQPANRRERTRSRQKDCVLERRRGTDHRVCTDRCAGPLLQRQHFLHCNEISCEMCGEKCSNAAALHDGKPVETRGLIHHKSGHRTLVRAWAIPLRDRYGSILGIIQTFQDRFLVILIGCGEAALQAISERILRTTANAARRLMEANGLQPNQGQPGPRICRSAPAQNRRSARPLQPAHFTDRAIHL